MTQADSTPSQHVESKGSSSPVSNPSKKYRSVSIADEVEHLEYYEPGGYHPVDLFDVLDDRFEVIYKLGHGGIATVWLCYEFRAQTWRAVKINAACRSSEDCSDLRVLKQMESQHVPQADLDKHHISLPTETFWLHGPNGQHLCSVLPVLGPKLSEWRKELRTIKDAQQIKRICYQVVEGLAFLHDKGICHGDFRPQNILMKLQEKSLDHIGRDEMCELLPAPDMEEIITMDGDTSPHAPKMVMSALAPDFWKDLVSNDVAIVDFGEAYEASSPPRTLGIPREYAGPEVIFGGDIGIGTDIWSLAYTLMETRLGAKYQSNIRQIIWRMERFMGPVPHPYRPVAERMVAEQSRSVGRLKSKKASESPVDGGQSLEPISASFKKLHQLEKRQAEGTGLTKPLEMALAARYSSREFDPGENGDSPSDEWVPQRLGEEEIVVLADLLETMFKCDPNERAAASVVLEHSWFERPAISQQPGLPNIPTRSIYHSSILLCVLGFFTTLFIAFLILSIIVNIQFYSVGVTRGMVVIHLIR